MNQQSFRVPYGMTVHGEDEISAVIDVLRSSTQMGKHVYEMESKVAGLFAKQHGIMLNSGTSANYLAIEIANLPKGSEVITPALTFSTTVAPLVKNNLVPAFVDVEPDTFNIDVNQIEGLITDKTKAIMVPNLIGNLPEWKKIRDIADHYNLLVIEDSADTLGATIHGRSTGYYSDISTTSFYGSHMINCAGNGGMLCVNEKNLAEQAKLLRSWGRSSSLFVESEAIENRFNTQIDGVDYDAKFIFTALGYNLEPSEMGAAFGLVQLSKLESFIELRQVNFKHHQLFFQSFQDWFILPKERPQCRTAWLAYPLIIKDTAPFKRRDLQIFLEKNGIQTRTIFTGNILRQPGFKHIEHKESIHGYPNANLAMQGGILIGCHQGLTSAMMEHIHQSFYRFFSSVVNVKTCSVKIE